MLHQSDAGNLIQRLWSGAPLQARLPGDGEGFFDAAGPTLPHYDDRRGVHRFHVRARALMRHDDQLSGVFVCDLSSGGIGVLSPVQLFPMDQPHLILTQEFQLRCRVARCRRLEERCYHVGFEIVEKSSEEIFKDLLRAAQRGEAGAVLLG